ncbi:transporter substrate-binding domain-containing protein [Benzoatithermus flavus]|uniref:Transporter substrate-binding domain-containing protein n=1 Tax=Benzoatithermus flavus TaxID=3108223 RepID=A0ABU8XSL3_9PROT
MMRSPFDADKVGPSRLRRRMALAVLAGAAVLVAGAAEAAQKAAVAKQPAAQGEGLKVAVEGEYPPFNETGPDGRLKGFDVDIAQALCAHIGARCELVKQQWDRMIPDLAAGKYDMIVSSMSITDTRRATMDFTDAYYHTPAKFVGRKGAFAGLTADGLAGKRIGVQRATIHDSYLTDTYGGRAEITRYDTLEKAQADLVAGKLDLLFADAIALNDGFLKTAKGKSFEFAGPDVRDPRWFGEGIGIAVRKGNTGLRDRLNQALAAIRADGTFERIEKKYFPFDIGDVKRTAMP